MRFTVSDKIIAYLTLLSGLSISAVAVWYSVAGLVSIFSAAVVPIIVMGVALEVSKLIATVWLKLNWQRAPTFIRAYLLGAIIILMIITSMGIFGFLSKAHSDQSLVSGDVQSKIAVYDQKIQTAKDNIDANRKALKQMDEAVDQVMGRSSDEKGADKAVALRRAQQKERARLQSEIASEQKTITALSEERAPIAAEVRKVEAEVGPIKYIAAFIYGDNPDANVLEKAVTWVIIIIVSVFDPLAVILLLASQYSFMWFRSIEERTIIVSKPEEPEPAVEIEEVPVTEDHKHEPIQCYKCGTELMNAPGIGPFCPNKKCDVVDATSGETIEFSVKPVQAEPVVQEKTAIDQWNEMIAEAEKAVEEEMEHEIPDTASDAEKIAMKNWKAENPDGSLKHQRKLLASGVIPALPWEDPKYMDPFIVAEEQSQTPEEIAKTYQLIPELEQHNKERIKPDLTEVIEPGQVDASSTLKLSDLKKKNLTYMEKVGKDQITRSV
jgi:hypothetical protein